MGSEVKAVGRVQSRKYEKKYEDGTVIEKVAYEVSISSLEVIEEKDGEGTAVEETEETAEAV